MIFLRRRERALLSVSLALLTISCRPQRSTNDNSTAETVISSTPPFQTKEPDRYRATRNLKVVNPNGETLTTQTFIARDGDMRRNESQVASKTMVYIEGPEGRFCLLPEEKIYAELDPKVRPPASADGDEMERSPEGLLHAETSNTTYQRLGKETIGTRTTDKYRIVVNGPNAANVTLNETLIWIDDALKMPIKTESRTPDGTQMSMEMSEITFEVDRNLFKVPADYRKLTFSEFSTRLLPSHK